MRDKDGQYTAMFSVRQFPTRDALGAASCDDVVNTIAELLKVKETISMIFAAAPSQMDFLSRFRQDSRVDFTRIHAFHMDEYIGLAEGAPQGFAQFLKDALFDHVPFASVNCLNGNAGDPEAECRRYEALLQENPADIVCLGIGENGHIAFNDPHVADFHDPRLVKIVELDQTCRTQQVHDGCFQEISQVPARAMTLTIPALISAPYHFCMVPAPTKAQAVYRTVTGSIEEACPASILRTCRQTVLYLDQDSGALL